MKKGLVILMITAVLIVPFWSFAESPVKVIVNGNQLELDVAPIIIEGRTLVPVRAIFESLGVLVEWDEGTNTVVGTKGNTKIRLPIGQLVAQKDGKDISLDVPAMVIDGRTLVPVRFIAESLGCNVLWDGEKYQVVIENRQEKLTIQEISREADAVVKIDTNNHNEFFGSGSGFIISEDGKVVTNYHVIDRMTEVEIIMNNGSKYKVDKVLKYDVEKDLALLKVDAHDLPCVDLGNSDWLQVGDQVVAIGSPYGILNTVTDGKISKISDEDIQLTAPIHPGSSGGALFDTFGKVIGITYMAIDEADDIGFAIPINKLKDLKEENNLSLQELIDKEYPNGIYQPAYIIGYPLSPTEIQVIWQQIPGAQHYIAYSGQRPEGPFEKIEIGKAERTTYEGYEVSVLSGLMPNQTYYIKIASVVDGKESECSERISATTLDIETSCEFIYDANLEKIIRAHLNKLTGAITKSDLKSITELNASSCDIDSLEGIQYLLNLEVLDLRDNNIKDITPLNGLRNMIAVDLSYNFIEDIGSLKGLSKLEFLNLEKNSISDINALAELIDLTDLYLSYNNISDISPLNNLSKLMRLTLNSNQITDINALSNFSELEISDIQNNPIED